MTKIFVTIRLILVLCLTISLDINFCHAQNYVWAKECGGSGNDWGHRIVTDAAGYVYVVGNFSGFANLSPYPNGAIAYTSFGSTDIFIQKFYPNGNIAWVLRVGSASQDDAKGIAVDASGNVYVTGSYAGVANFDPMGVILNSGPGTASFVIKFNSSGSMVWAKSISNTYTCAISLDALNNIYLAGTTLGTPDFDPGPGVYNLPATPFYSSYVLKLNSSGAFNWVKGISSISPAIGFVKTMVTNPQGEVYSAGYFSGTVDFDPGPGFNYLTTNSNTNRVYAEKLDSSGNLLWVKAMGDTLSTNVVSISIDPAGNLYHFGTFNSACDFDPDAGQLVLTPQGQNDIYIQKLNSSGQMKWTKQITGPSYETPYGIAVDATGNSYLCGVYDSNIDFDPGPLVYNDPSIGFDDIFLEKLDSSGNFIWMKDVGGTFCSVWANAITVDAAGYFYITGMIGGAADFDPGPSQHIVTWGAGNQEDVIIAKYSQCPPPVSPFPIAGPNPICPGSTNTFSAPTVPGATAYIWSVPGGWANTPSANSIVVTANISSGYMVITAQNACGYSPEDSLHVIISGTPPTTANAGTDQFICDSVCTLAANNPLVGAGFWTLVSGTATIANPASNISGVSSIGAGLNILRWTTTLGSCSTQDDVGITRFLNPTTANAGADQHICGSSTTLAGNTPLVGTGTWTLLSGSSTITNSSQSNSTFTNFFNTGTTEMLKWKIINGTCPSSNDTVLITRDYAPGFPNAGSDFSVCGTSTTLNGNSPIYGTSLWTLVSGAGAIALPNSSSTGITGLGNGINTFRLTFTNFSCTSNDPISVTGYAPATIANAGSDDYTCNGTIILAGNTAIVGTGTWSVISGTANIVSPNSPVSVVNGIVPGTCVLRWTISNNGCFTNFDEVTINSGQNPTTASAGSDNSFCSSSSSLAGNTPILGTGMWTIVSGSANIITPNSPTSGLNSIGLGHNTFRWTTTNGFCTTFDDVILTQDTQPTSSNAGLDQHICGSAASLSGNTPVIGTGTWSLLSGMATILSPNSPSSNLSGLGNGINSFQWSISNGTCSGTPSSVNITRDLLPSIAFAGLDSIVCDTQLVMGANIPVVGTGVWSIVDGNATVYTMNSPSSLLSWPADDTLQLRWTISNGVCPDSYDSVFIFGKSIPVIPTAISGPNFVCAGNSYIYSVSPDNNVDFYTWNIPSGWSGTSLADTITVIPTSTGGLVSVYANNYCGSSSPQSVTIAADALPVITSLITGDDTICSGTSNIYSILSVPSATSYVWSVPAGWNGSSITNSLVATAGTLSGLVSVGASNACGTSVLQTLAIVVNPTPLPPIITMPVPGILHSSALTGNQWYNNAVLIPAATSQDFTYTQNGIYSVMLTIDGCSSYSSDFPVSNVGFDSLIQLADGTVFIFPNPFSSELFVQSEQNILSIDFNDVTGRKVISTAGDSRIETSGLSPGIYFLRIVEPDKSIFVKLVKY